MELILASSSPRRILLLKKLGLRFRVVPPSYEVEVETEDPIEYVELKALEKARAVARLFTEGIIIAADTVVFMDKEILGKPRSIDEAKDFLRRLSGKTHYVATGVAVIDAATMREIVDSEVTKVKFRELSEEEIELYVKTGEPLDKAGGYAIQGLASVFIERIEGDFWNVVGLPIPLLYYILKTYFRYDLLKESKQTVSLV